MQTPELKSPASMSAADRAAEIAAILAAAIVRGYRDFDLGFRADQSVHTTPYQKRRL
jgi:hypothetical protein